MKSLLPKHLQDLFNNQQGGEHESRKFSEDVAFNDTVRKLADSNGESEDETDPQETKAKQYQLQRREENLILWKSLGQREQEVVALVCMGQKNHQIAEAMGIAHGTAKSHLEHILRKLNMSDRHAIRLAFRDWDFEIWWKNRHLVPTPYPPTSTYR